MGPCWITIKGA